MFVVNKNLSGVNFSDVTSETEETIVKLFLVGHSRFLPSNYEQTLIISFKPRNYPVQLTMVTYKATIRGKTIIIPYKLNLKLY